jgi:hypothetical protein
LAILWEIKGLQEKKGNFASLQIHAPVVARRPTPGRTGRVGMGEIVDGSIA